MYMFPFFLCHNCLSYSGLYNYVHASGKQLSTVVLPVSYRGTPRGYLDQYFNQILK